MMKLGNSARNILIDALGKNPVLYTAKFNDRIVSYNVIWCKREKKGGGKMEGG
jgi:hypothetical protein